jgi:hypothetical protein
MTFFVAGFFVELLIIAILVTFMILGIKLMIARTKNLTDENTRLKRSLASSNFEIKKANLLNRELNTLEKEKTDEKNDLDDTDTTQLINRANRLF